MYLCIYIPVNCKKKLTHKVGLYMRSTCLWEYTVNRTSKVMKLGNFDFRNYLVYMNLCTVVLESEKYH